MSISIRVVNGIVDLPSVRNIVIGIANNVTHIYTDGGLCGSNPSEVGASWAVVLADRDDNQVFEMCGIIPATPDRPIECNLIEQIALTIGLEIMPEKWTGILCSDSQNAIGRATKGWQTNGVPSNVMNRCFAAINRLGKIKFELLKGHPSKKHLEDGIGKNGNRVSKHNVRVDELCKEMARERVIQLMANGKPVSKLPKGLKKDIERVQAELPLVHDEVTRFMPIIALLWFAPRLEKRTRATPDEVIEKCDESQRSMAKFVFGFWRAVNKKKTRESNKLLKMIIDRSKEGYTKVDLCHAAFGILYSPHHQGENKNGIGGKGIKYDDASYVYRDSERVAKWIALAEDHGITDSLIWQKFMPEFEKTGQVDRNRPNSFVNKMTGEGLK